MIIGALSVTVNNATLMKINPKLVLKRAVTHVFIVAWNWIWMNILVQISFAIGNNLKMLRGYWSFKEVKRDVVDPKSIKPDLINKVACFYRSGFPISTDITATISVSKWLSSYPDTFHVCFSSHPQNLWHQNAVFVLKTLSFIRWRAHLYWLPAHGNDLHWLIDWYALLGLLASNQLI